MDLLSEPFKFKCSTAYKNWTNGTTINKENYYSIESWMINEHLQQWVKFQCEEIV